MFKNYMFGQVALEFGPVGTVRASELRFFAALVGDVHQQIGFSRVAPAAVDANVPPPI